VLWLSGQQDRESGCLASADGNTAFLSTASAKEELVRHDGLIRNNDDVYQHSLATLALARVHEHYPTQGLARVVQKATNYLSRARNPYGMWRYAVPPDGDSDTCVSGLAIMATKVAERAGFRVDLRAYPAMVQFLNEMTDESSGRVGYTERGSRSSRALGFNAELFPRDASEAMTAVALHCRFMLGQDPSVGRSMRDHAKLILRDLPRWSPARHRIDLYYWLFGTAAMWQMGGKYWVEWRKALVPALSEAQRKDGGDLYEGSWDPAGAWGFAGGRVYSTAACMLCLMGSAGAGSIMHPERRR